MNSKLFLLPFLGALSAFGPFVLDLYLPALPIIESYFNTSTAAVQLTLSTTMAGLGFGQLIAGPLSDKFGRKVPLLFSLTLYTISTIVIFFTPSIELFIAARSVQGLASAGSIVISRAIVGDLYEGEQMRKFFSLLIVINSLAPIFSPILGSAILEITSWRGIFVALSAIGILLFVASFCFKESMPSSRRLTGSLLSSYAIYFRLIRSKDFLVFVLVGAGALGAIFTYISVSPFIFVKYYGFSESHFALAFGLNGAGFGLAAFLGSKLSAKNSILFGIAIFGITSVLLVFALTFSLGAIFLMILFFALLFSIGFIMPTTSFYAMSAARQFAGSASAMLGFAGFGMGGLVAASVGYADIFISSSVAIFLCALLCCVSVFLAYRRRFLR